MKMHEFTFLLIQHSHVNPNAPKPTLKKKAATTHCFPERALSCTIFNSFLLPFSQKAVSDLHWKNVARTKKAQQNS